MRALLGAAVAFVLAGCEDMPKARSESEIRDIAIDVADDVASSKANNLEARIEQLESKLSELETENSNLRSEVDVLAANDRHDTESVDRLFKNDRMFAQRLNMPVEQ